MHLCLFLRICALSSIFLGNSLLSFSKTTALSQSIRCSSSSTCFAIALLFILLKYTSFLWFYPFSHFELCFPNIHLVATLKVHSIHYPFFFLIFSFFFFSIFLLIFVPIFLTLSCTSLFLLSSLLLLTFLCIFPYSSVHILSFPSSAFSLLLSSLSVLCI